MLVLRNPRTCPTPPGPRHTWPATCVTRNRVAILREKMNEGLVNGVVSLKSASKMKNGCALNGETRTCNQSPIPQQVADLSVSSGRACMSEPHSGVECRRKSLFYWGEPERAPQLGDQRRLCLSSYVLPYSSSPLASRTLWLHYRACTNNYTYPTCCTVYMFQGRQHGSGPRGAPTTEARVGETNVPLNNLNPEKNG